MALSLSSPVVGVDGVSRFAGSSSDVNYSVDFSMSLSNVGITGNANGEIDWIVGNYTNQYACDHDLNALVGADGVYLNINTQVTTDFQLDADLFAVYAIVSDEYLAAVLFGQVSVGLSDLNGDGRMDSTFSNTDNGQSITILNFDWVEDGVEIIGTYDGGVTVAFG